MMKFLKNEPLHLFLFPALFVANHFFALVVTKEIHPPLETYGLWAISGVLSLAVCIIPPYLLYRLLSLKLDKTKSALLATVIFIPFYFFQEFFVFSIFLLADAVRMRWLMLLVAIAVATAAFFILRSRRSLSLLNECLNVMALLLLGYVLITLVLFFDSKMPKRLSYQPAVHTVNCADCPDIYFFLLDSYTSNKSLRDYFQFDNSDFTKNLEALGFVVADEAYSSYTKTFFSLGSTLNMGKMKGLDQYYEQDVLTIIDKSTVVSSLRDAGYKVMNYSPFDLNGQPKHYSLTQEYRPSFLNGIFQNSVLKYVFDNMDVYYNLYAVHTGILEQVSEQTKLAAQSPRFFYAHILAPHAPFVINESGEHAGFMDQKRTQAESYVTQVKGLNTLVYRTIKEILATSKDPIIIIQGDHGSRMLNGENKDKESRTVFMACLTRHKMQPQSLQASNEIFNLIFREVSSN